MINNNYFYYGLISRQSLPSQYQHFLVFHYIHCTQYVSAHEKVFDPQNRYVFIALSPVDPRERHVVCSHFPERELLFPPVSSTRCLL